MSIRFSSCPIACIASIVFALSSSEPESSSVCAKNPPTSNAESPPAAKIEADATPRSTVTNPPRDAVRSGNCVVRSRSAIVKAPTLIDSALLLSDSASIAPLAANIEPAASRDSSPTSSNDSAAFSLAPLFILAETACLICETLRPTTAAVASRASSPNSSSEL